jgi:RHH-type rel operon transcriptional repressor/antitoxin RelB
MLNMYNKKKGFHNLLAVRLPADIEKRLDALAKATGRSKSFYVREAILEYLEDLEDIYLAEEVLVRVRRGADLSHRGSGKTPWPG